MSPVTPLNKQGAGGGAQLSIAQLLQNLDVDGDGDIDEEDRKIQQTLKQMDGDGDGMISLRELVAIGKGKVEDENKMATMKKWMIIGGVIALLFIALSLCATIAAIELTKESRNQAGVMTDAATGNPVMTAALTGGMDPNTGVTDSTMKDADGNIAASGTATGALVLNSKTMTRASASMIKTLTLPVKYDGKPMTMSLSVTGFELASDGSKAMLYTASGGLVLIKEEQIFVYQKGIDGELRTITIDPERSGTRRSYARRLAKLRKMRRSLLQTDGSPMPTDMPFDPTMPPMPSIGPNGTPNPTPGGSDGMVRPGGCEPGTACGAGDCQDSMCSPPPCMIAGQEYDYETGECMCPPDSEQVMDDWGYEFCKCMANTAEVWYTDADYMSHKSCMPCPEGTQAAADGFSCFGCPIMEGKDSIWKYGTEDMSLGSTVSPVPTQAGFCDPCSPGTHKEVMEYEGGYVFEQCQCDDPCEYLQYDWMTDKNSCTACDAGMSVVWDAYGNRWCAAQAWTEYGEQFCFDVGNPTGNYMNGEPFPTFDNGGFTWTPVPKGTGEEGPGFDGPGFGGPDATPLSTGEDGSDNTTPISTP